MTESIWRAPIGARVVSRYLDGLAAQALIAAGLVFVSSYISLVPYRNQNTYLLHAEQFGGPVADWLANSTDLFPVTTELSRVLMILGDPGLAIGYLLCVFAFVLSVLLVVRSGRGEQVRRGLLLPVAIALPWIIAPLIGANLFGLADQYMLGGAWQPSEAGAAALMLAIALYVAKRPLWAAVAIGAGVALHPGSALAGTIVMASICLGLITDRRPRIAALAGVISVAVALPVLVAIRLKLAAEAPEAVERTQEILVHQRIPHHALPEVWFGVTSVLQVAVVALAVLMWWSHTRLAFIVGVSAAISLILTGLSILADSEAFYLLFPWRVFAVLVPLSASLLSVRFLVPVHRSDEPDRPWPRSHRGLVAALVAVAIFGSAAAHARNQITTGVHFVDDGAYSRGLAAIEAFLPPDGSVYLSETKAEMLLWVRDNGPRDAAYVVPPELEAFRLFTGRPIFADWKSHPYLPSEMLAWLDRVETVDALYTSGPCSSDILADPRFAGYAAAVYPLDRFCDQSGDVIFRNAGFVVVMRR